jgi:phage protein U
MADQSKAWPLVEGTGRQHGLWIITKVNKTSSVLFRDAAAGKIEFTLPLARLAGVYT